MPNSKYGRVKVFYGSIHLISTGGISTEPKNSAICIANDNWLGIRAGINHSWLAVRVTLHQERPDASESAEWDSVEEAEVTFTGPPFFYVDSHNDNDIDAPMQTLDIPAGVYGVRVSETGISRSFKDESGVDVTIEKAPPPDALLQQVRIDLWPAPQ